MEKTENNSVKVRTKASFSSEMNERERRNQEIAYQAACEAIVMLKNDGVLPLKSKKVAMFGRGIIETIKGGTGSGEVNERHSVSIFEGFKEALWEITNERQHLEYKEKYEQAQKDFVKRQRRKAYSNLFKIVDTLFEPFLQERVHKLSVPCGMFHFLAHSRSLTLD